MNSFENILTLESYFLNPWALAPGIVGVLSFFCSLIFFRLESRSVIHRACGLFFLTISFWLSGLSLMLLAQDPMVAFFFSFMMIWGMMVTPVTLLNLSSCVIGRYSQQKWISVALLALAMVFLVQGSYGYFGMHSTFFGFFPIILGFQEMALGLLAISTLISMGNYVYRHCKEPDAKKRMKIRFFILLHSVFLLSFVDLLVIYLKMPPMSYVILFGVVVSLLSFKLDEYQARVNRRVKEMENDIERKSAEISHVVGELKATQLKMIEAGKISAVASLSAGILHQISQPITAIHGFVRFIKREMTPEDVFYKPIILMDEQSQYLKEMLEDLMELIRHREIKKEQINVNVYLNRAINLLTDELRIRRVNWDLILEDDLPLILADGVHLQQVFMNITINGIQALSLLPRGAIRYLKIMSEYDRSAEKIRISFKDSGPGLTEEDRQHIFEPFFSTKTKGSGIGLALCKDLIDEHGGKIEVESTPGQGALFAVILPCHANTLTAKAMA